MSVKEVFYQALALSEPERAELAHQLLQSLSQDSFQEEFDDAWLQEIERRMELVAQGKDNAREWREVLRELREDLRERKPQ